MPVQHTHAWRWVVTLVMMIMISDSSGNKCGHQGNQDNGSPFVTNPIVTVTEGRLKGALRTLVNGEQYYSFKGIPYAQPPIGDLRFTAPLPAKPWNNLRNATEHGPVCMQYDTTKEQYLQGSEDCLTLNVYTRSLDPAAKLPIMVFIHGGSFMTGSGNSDTYGPDLLIQHDVILVTMNYRLEVLGFLSLKNGDVPGNAGMKDQVAALRWIQDNIEKFGGDPKSVTLFGESAGAASVTYHMLSPMSNGLFHKAIVQSGVCLEDWAQGQDSVNRAFRVGKVLGKDLKNRTELINFLRQVNPANLTNLTFETQSENEKHRSLREHFVPIIEEVFHRRPEPFISENPIDLLLKGKVNKVPLMIGYNSGEGLFTLAQQLRDLDSNNKAPGNFLPRSLVERLSKEKIASFGKRIKRFYVGKRPITRFDLEPLRDIRTDVSFAYNTHRFAYLYQSNTNESVYMYRFNYDTDLNIVKKFLGYTTLAGASHADDLFYIFYNSLNQKILNQDSKLKDIVYKITRLWTNFAKKGQPTSGDLGVHWTPYTTANKEYLKLEDNISMGCYADRRRIQFWNELYKEAGYPYITG